MKYLITGVAGFIGSAIAKKLLEDGHFVFGIDNLNDYYDVNLKLSRLKTLENPKFNFEKIDISDRNAIESLFKKHEFKRVIHLAAQAGVRYSIEAPHSYVESNLVGFINILEGCRATKVEHLIYASSSSVYGLNKKVPFSTCDIVDHPVSLYAATKKSNELMAHSYSHLYGIPTTGLRFFTVYGSWGRPDMAPFIFTRKILNGDTIDINNNGDMWRDFTHIKDIVNGIIKVTDLIPDKNEKWTVENGSSAYSSAPYAIYNIGHGTPISLMEFIGEIENQLGIEAKKNFRGMQPGDVYQTYADVSELSNVTGYTPSVDLKQGVSEFIDWYKDFYL